MKLSEATTDQAADIMLQIAPDIEILVNDDKLASMIKNRKTTGDKKAAAKIGGMSILKIATYLLKEHRSVTWNILGALNQKTSEEVGKQLFPTTIKQIVETIQDEELLGFFTSSGQSAPETPSDI